MLVLTKKAEEVKKQMPYNVRTLNFDITEVGQDEYMLTFFNKTTIILNSDEIKELRCVVERAVEKVEDREDR